jgi:preprotein translocase subunit YajC
MNVLGIFLQEQTSATGSSGLSGILMIVAIVVIFYFFMIRPQQKRQKDIQKAREAMRPGDKVVTAGGIHVRFK